MDWVIGLLSTASLVAFIAIVVVMVETIILVRFRIRFGSRFLHLFARIIEYAGNVDLWERPAKPPRYAPHGATQTQR